MTVCPWCGSEYIILYELDEGDGNIGFCQTCDRDLLVSDLEEDFLAEIQRERGIK